MDELFTDQSEVSVLHAGCTTMERNFWISVLEQQIELSPFQ